jgi:hypothetical protein
LVGALTLAALCLPSAALAGTYTWSMPSQFTATAPGSNPDHDGYGGTPWSYAVGPSGTLQFSDAFDGGLAGWTDTPSSPHAIVAVNPTGSPVDGIGPGQLAMRAPRGGSVALAWTSPLTATASLSGSVTQISPGGSACGFSWTLSEAGAIIATGSGSATIPATAVTIAQGETIYLVIRDTSTSYSASCDTAAVTLGAGIPSTPPVVTLYSSGTMIRAAQPVFGGNASTRYADSGSVTVRVYRWSSSGASLAETLTAAVVNGLYLVVPSPRLQNGTYTAQAEQTDGGGDSSISGVVAFTVNNATPRVTLHSLGRKPLRLSRPTFAGTASTSAGAATSVYIAIFAGRRISPAGVRLLVANRLANGRFSLTIGPGLGLPDGEYTALAVQDGPGPNGISSPQTFQIKVHPPAVTINTPDIGSVLTDPRPVFSGQAGAVAGDFQTITLVLYRGVLTTGRPLATTRITRRGAAWSLTWPRKLPIGLYTALVKQSDNAGHTAVTAGHTFFVTLPPRVIGFIVNLNRKGYASVEVTCTTAGGTCSGDILALTEGAFQPVPGGPLGPLRVLFVHVSIPAGQAVLVRQKLPSQVFQALRRARGVGLLVSASLSAAGYRPIRISVPRLLVVG